MKIIIYIMFAVVLGSFYFADKTDEAAYVKDDIDLNLVLDITVDTLHEFQNKLDAQVTEPDADQAFLAFADELARNYNNPQPAIYSKGSIGVSPQADASLMAFDDANTNLSLDQGEKLLFKIEIDGENARIIASSNSGAVQDHSFSGGSLLTGYLIGSMLSRQRMSGVSPASLANKKPITAKQATTKARSRAGSGSHSRGK